MIRRASDADSNGILSCLRTAFEPYRKDYTQAAFEDTVLTVASLRERQKVMSVFVAVTELGEVIGTIACQALRGGEGHLRGMAVNPAWHSQGISKRLLDTAESELRAQGCTRITLDTTQYLQRAIRFYERNGYRASGRISDFFGMPLYEYVKPIA
jgi:ribosomal protein S18 acetylase RimI-like enzyme